jgi:multidrug efflux system membrane fusion protein
MTMKFEQPLRRGGFCALVLVMLAGCSGSEPQEAPPPAPQVSTVTVAASSLELTEDLPGRVAALRVAEIRPQVSGIVQRRLFEQGAEVRAGQPLFQINAAPFHAEADMASAALQRADAALARAKLQVTRLEPLVKADAVSRQTFDDAVSQREQAAADVTQARATLARRQLDLKFATVEAPISGRIDQALITEGALVGSSDASPMARVQQIDQVYVDVRQPAASLDAVQQALGAAPADAAQGLSVAIVRGNGEPYDIAGRMLFSGVSVDAATGDVLLRVLVDNPKRQLLPGMFVRARVPRPSYADAVTVPQQAVVRSGGQPHLWIVDAQNAARFVAVDLGELADRRYRVRSGIDAGQKVVVEGIERLSDGLTVVPNDWTPPEAMSAVTAR